MPRKKALAEEKFEVLLARLEEIVRRLEDGDFDLEESLAIFEEGVNLSRRLNERLAQAEQKVEILTRTAQGQLKATPFPGSDSGPDEPEDE